MNHMLFYLVLVIYATSNIRYPNFTKYPTFLSLHPQCNYPYRTIWYISDCLV